MISGTGVLGRMRREGSSTHARRSGVAVHQLPSNECPFSNFHPRVVANSLVRGAWAPIDASRWGGANE